MNAFREILEDHRVDRKRNKRIDALEPDDAEIYSKMVEALGPFGETELGAAALRAAKPAGDDTLNNLGGGPAAGRADEGNLGSVGRGAS